jgi:hypothetical protein
MLSQQCCTEYTAGPRHHNLGNLNAEVPSYTTHGITSTLILASSNDTLLVLWQQSQPSSPDDHCRNDELV